MKRQIIYLFALAFVLMLGCQKEISFDTVTGASTGSLQSAAGDCLPKTVNGSYVAGTALVPATNTINVQVTTTKAGSYLVYTDTVNGYYFRATGTFVTVGTNNVTLKSSGTPLLAQTDNFIVHYDTSSCTLPVTVMPSGTAAAVFTLAGTSGNCTGAVVNGTYSTTAALNSGNTVIINVNVTTIGTYAITTTYQGMTFSASSSFTTLGAQTVTLNGSGTPTTNGINNVPITAGSSTCSFVVNVGSQAIGTLSGGPTACTPSTVNGTYTIATALVSTTNTVQVQVNVTTIGTYTITTNTVDGFSFSSAGTFVTPGIQMVTLNGTGTPTAAGSQAFMVTFGTSSCTFNVTVGGATAAVYTFGGSPGTCTPATINGTYTAATALTSANTVQVQINVTVAGTYSITTTSDGMTFTGSGSAAVGTQLVTLNGAGTPTNSGAQIFTLTIGSNTCTFTVNVSPALSNDYFPRTTNSNWSYELDNVSTDSLLINVIPNTLSAGGFVYNIFMQNDGTAVDTSGYFRKSSGDYSRWTDLAYYLSFDNSQWVSFVFIKDDQPAGTIWYTPGYSGTISGTPVTIRIKFTLLQKDVPKSLTTSTGTANYNNTIVVQEQYELQQGASWVSLDDVFGFYKDYYSRGIGWILDEYYTSSGASTPSDIQAMRRYQVF